ncbi:MAG: hypothetical protein U1E17_01425 [Geminicoccaceae bacterium]
MQAMEELPEEQSRLLRIFYFEEKPHSQIGERAWPAARHGRQRLRLALHAARPAERPRWMTDCPTVDELLMAHAAGRLPEPSALVVGTYLALCPRARSRYSRFLALGGLLLERAEPAPLAADAFARLLERLDQEEQPAPACQRPVVASACAAPGLPRPLRDYLPGPLEAQRWRCYGSAAELELRLPTPGYRTTLVRVRAGRQVPRHTHEGHELDPGPGGRLLDKTGHYRRGDLKDRGRHHRPSADRGCRRGLPVSRRDRRARRPGCSAACSTLPAASACSSAYRPSACLRLALAYRPSACLRLASWPTGLRPA